MEPSARVPEWAALFAHPQFREFGERPGGGANPSAFKSGPGEVAKFARGQAGGKKVGVIRRFYMQSILKWKK